MNGDQALKACLKLPVRKVLDLGSGPGHHAQIFRDHGKDVTTLDFGNADICGDFNEVEVPYFDLIWCNHVLEHQPNVNLFLRKVLDHCDYFAVTVPPAKHNIVGGHLTLWNAGLLLYNLILAGFDCSEAKVKSYGYNVSVITKTTRRPELSLKMDCGDIETLSPYFPISVEQGFDGQLAEVNW